MIVVHKNKKCARLLQQAHGMFVKKQQKDLSQTSYAGIIRIRLRVLRTADLSLSAPLFLCPAQSIAMLRKKVKCFCISILRAA